MVKDQIPGALGIVHGESNEACEGLLNDLFKRGLECKNLKLIITDGAKGFANAINFVYQHVKHQRCWVHKLRNATKHLKKNDIKPFKIQVQKIYDAPTHRDAVATFKYLQKHWRSTSPKAVNCIAQV